MDGLGILTGIALFAAYPLTPDTGRPVQEWGIDHMVPIHADRQIRTTNLQWRGLGKDLAPLRTELRLGLTASRVTGQIRQLHGRIDDGSLTEVTLDSPGWGVGPTAEARFTVWQNAGFAVKFHVSAALLVYDRHFPAGGDRYNGMLQLGPSVDWPLGPTGHVSLGWRVGHVSNGQGLGAHNPSYEARGVNLQLRLPL
jgi:hypothetical protein